MGVFMPVEADPLPDSAAFAAREPSRIRERRDVAAVCRRPDNIRYNTLDHGMIRACRLVGAGMIYCLAACGHGRSDSGIDPDNLQDIEVRIDNAATGPIRCIAVLAHFVTRTLPYIPAGGTGVIVLGRHGDDGSLSYGAREGRPMMIENILCGLDSDWSATMADLSIQTLRSGSSSRHGIRCALAGSKLSCVP